MKDFQNEIENIKPKILIEERWEEEKTVVTGRLFQNCRISESFLKVLS